MDVNFCHQKEEYLSLRKEIEGMLAELSSLERNAILACAAVYSFITTYAIDKNGLTPFYRAVAFGTPVFISVFSALRAWSLNQHFGTLSTYMTKVEEVTALREEGFIGWEHFFAKDWRRGTQTRMRMGFWIFLVVATCTIWAASMVLC
jgi:hypothetical protein